MHSLEAHRPHQAGGNTDALDSQADRSLFTYNFQWRHDFCTRSAAKVYWGQHYQFTDGSSVLTLVKILLRVQNQIDFSGRGRQMPSWYLCHTKWNQDCILSTKRINCTCWEKAQGENQGHLIPLLLTFLTVPVIQIQFSWVFHDRTEHALLTEH